MAKPTKKKAVLSPATNSKNRAVKAKKLQQPSGFNDTAVMKQLPAIITAGTFARPADAHPVPALIADLGEPGPCGYAARASGSAPLHLG